MINQVILSTAVAHPYWIISLNLGTIISHIFTNISQTKHFSCKILHGVWENFEFSFDTKISESECLKKSEKLDQASLRKAIFVEISGSTAPSPIDPVLTVQPDHCYIFFSLKNTFKNYFINYHNIIHLSLVRRTRQTLKTIPLIMLSIDWQIWQP